MMPQKDLHLEYSMQVFHVDDRRCIWGGHAMSLVIDLAYGVRREGWVGTDTEYGVGMQGHRPQIF